MQALAEAGQSMKALLPMAVGGGNSEESESSTSDSAASSSLEEEVCALFPSLSFKERVVGCAACMTTGYLLSFGGFSRFGKLMLGDPIPFVMITTFGNILSLSGSLFLMGPTAQLKKMFHKKRKVATILYLSSMLVTIVVALTLHQYKWAGLVLVLLVLVQYVAIAWYCLSYIPFARKGIKRLFNKFYANIMDES
mmetsp:Transcript_61633/g.74146  ORF Transcript_61633/g.74146 Transcript_61633/m.74146 type:complete len:195 (-) Transcript_61633:334-918(-)